MSLIYDNQEKTFFCLLKFGHCFNGAGELIVSKKLASGEMEEMLKGGDLTAPIRYVTFGSDYHDVETTAYWTLWPDQGENKSYNSTIGTLSANRYKRIKQE